MLAGVGRHIPLFLAGPARVVRALGGTLTGRTRFAGGGPTRVTRAQGGAVDVDRG